jgi:hypothetical protein
MRDPLPENIDGRKEYRHAFEHRIDWGQLVLGGGVIAAAYVAYRAFVDGGSSGQQDAQAPDVEIVEDTPQFEGNTPWSGAQQDKRAANR